ncbi:MAG: IS1 family transposase [Pleurocapsa sp.]
MPICPNCDSRKTVKNGRIHNGKQRFKCNECNRQFVENPEKIVIDQEKRDLIDRLLLARISLAGISRAVKVSAKWLQTYVNQKYALVPKKITVTPKKRVD